MFFAHRRSLARAIGENISPMREGRCALSGRNLTYAGVTARFWGKNLTHAGGPARSFGKKTHLCEMAGAHFRGSNLTHARGRIQSSGKKSHAYRWICASFRGRNLTLADGWRALSGMILPLFERGRRMCPRFLGFCNRRADLFCAAL